MQDDARDTPARRRLLELLPLRNVQPGTFGGTDEAREKDCDQIVALVESWLIANPELSAGKREQVAAAWRREMGRDDMIEATIDQIEADNGDREALKRVVAEMVPRYAWQVKDRLIIRMHPQSWNRYSMNISGALMAESDAVRKKVVERCNFRQRQDLVTISTTEIRGDEVCGAHLLR